MIEKTTRTKRERERSKEKKLRSDMDKLAYPLTPDRSAVETHYNRSRKIRFRIYRALVDYSLNRSFADPSDLAYQVANDAKCSYECSMRWVKQYTARNGDFYFFDDEHRLGYRRKID